MLRLRQRRYRQCHFRAPRRNLRRTRGLRCDGACSRSYRIRDGRLATTSFCRRGSFNFFAGHVQVRQICRSRHCVRGCCRYTGLDGRSCDCPARNARSERPCNRRCQLSTASSSAKGCRRRRVLTCSRIAGTTSSTTLVTPSTSSLGFPPVSVQRSRRCRELTAIVEAIKFFDYYLDSGSFIVATDHKPITFVMQQSHDKAPARRKRQVDYLSQFDITFEFLPGSDNTVADALSRIGVISSEDVAEFEDVSRYINRIDAIRMLTKISADVLAFAQSSDDELRGIVKDTDNPLKLTKICWGPTNAKFYAEVNSDHIRPYVPSGLRYKIFESFHGLSHTSSRITDRVIRKFYVWPDMSQDIALFCKACVACQKSKVTRHNKPAPAHFEAPDARFQHVHIDIVGPLPEVEGFTHIFTMIDRFTRWPEAVPLKDTKKETIAFEFFKRWISRFGPPSVITSDQGGQFESELFAIFLQAMGIERKRTTPYHPASNGMIERWHRDLKSALMCKSDTENWLQALPMVMLGLRTRTILDTDMSPAEMVYDLLNRPDVSLEDLLNEGLPDGESTLSQDEIIMDDHPKQVKITRNLLNNDKGYPDLVVPSTSHGARDDILRPDRVPSSRPFSHGVELNDELDLGLSLTQAGSGLARGSSERRLTSCVTMRMLLRRRLRMIVCSRAWISNLVRLRNTFTAEIFTLGRRPHIKWFEVPKDKQTFEDACLGALPGHDGAARGKKHATAILYYSRNKGIRGACCCEEIIEGGEEPEVYRPHLVGLPWPLQESELLPGAGFDRSCQQKKSAVEVWQMRWMNIYSTIHTFAQDVQDYRFFGNDPVPRRDDAQHAERTFSFAVTFKQLITRNHIIRRKRAHGLIKYSDLQQGRPDAEIRLYELLPGPVYKLFRAAKARSRERKYASVWADDGRVFARKSASSERIKLVTESDLNKLA
ncbi:unnamed protein product [Trichogramma brassicae]|uniref:RNA-directed DNA polymerase n=1 Tax=Trichogramma brassicae TaxID=86971 RepID=A0A6H5I7T8_9HYME|nr:unnamed protein product [Trichogramma brassicae]